MARVSAIESGSPTPTECERKVDPQFANLTPVILAQLAYKFCSIAYETRLLATSSSTTARARLFLLLWRKQNRTFGDSHFARFPVQVVR
jgi:hypothetical protein